MVNNEDLFQYLRQILYDPTDAVLEAKDLSPAQQKLAEGLQVLGLRGTIALVSLP